MQRVILISGGDGFVGNAMASWYLARGEHVFVVDDHSSGVPRAPHPRRTLVRQDVCRLEPSQIPRTSLVLHLASPAAPSLFARDPMRVIRPNTAGTEKLLEIALRDGCRMIFASTSEVYGDGDPARGPGQAFVEDQRVTHGTLTERSCYAAAKRVGEEIVNAARGRGADATSVRLFNVYGPGMDPTLPGYGRVVPSFVRSIARGEPLTVHGDGRQVRSFLWIDDLVEAITRLARRPGSLPAALNIGRDEPIEIRELADLVERTAGTKVGRRHVERATDDPAWRRPDCGRLHDLVRWTPRVGLAEGVQRLVDAELGRPVRHGEEAAPCP